MSTVRRFRLGLLAALVALLVAADVGVAQTATDAGLAIVNNAQEPVKVYAFGENEEDRILLGWVGGTELEYFQIPSEARTSQGTFRVAIQGIIPLPQIGVPAEPYPLEVTGTLSPAAEETVRVVVEEEGEALQLSYDMVR